MLIEAFHEGRAYCPQQDPPQLGLQPRDSLGVRLEGQHIVVTPRNVCSRKARIVRDPVTGLPVITAGAKAPKLTSAEVREVLADFP